MRTIRALLLVAVLSALIQGCGREEPALPKDYPITPVDFTRVHLHDGFWKQWVETASHSTIPFAFQKCEETGRIDNFIFAAGLKDGKFRGRYGFDDSDVYKIMEGAAYALMLEENPELELYLDTLISYVAGAQEEDGYLYTAWTLKANEYNDFLCCTYGEDRWVETPNASHEFYNAGHMYEAAVAHYQATGKRTFLDVALKNANLVYDVCITQGNPYVPGHQEIEIGLVKLYRVTGIVKYMELARHLLDLRSEVKDDEYSQAHLPVTEQREAVGHAVRANYMYSAMADVAALAGDPAYLAAVDALWGNVVGRKLSITGGVGASHHGEAYGDNYELPNQPYNETCAAIANVYWNHRMFLLHGEAKYIDVLERSLYNGVLPGLSLDGTLFFYPNTLQHDGEATFNQGVNGRSPWFNCSCCPSNLSRFVPSVAGYAYAVRNDEVYINLFMNGRAELEMEKGILELVQRSNYPWDGTIEMEITGEKPLEAKIHIRIPAWALDRPVPSDLFTFLGTAEEGPSIQVNGETAGIELHHGYATILREWKKGDRIVLELPMQARAVIAHDSVAAKKGLVAIQCGPLVYCAEQTDNRQEVLEAKLGSQPVFSARFEPGLLGGVNVLEGEGLALVPYYAWANRGAGKMNVWFRMGG